MTTRNSLCLQVIYYHCLFAYLVTAIEIWFFYSFIFLDTSEFKQDMLALHNRLRVLCSQMKSHILIGYMWKSIVIGCIAGRDVYPVLIVLEG